MKPLAVQLSLVAGVMDATTGVLLVVAPGAILGWAGVTLPGGASASILLRWIGVFVSGVGLSYLWAIAPRDEATRAHRLPGVWGATTVIRTGVALFCLVAVGTGELDAIWLVVGCTDGAFAVTQAWGQRAGWLGS